MRDFDPTRINVDLDPTTMRFSGVAYHQNMPFETTLISQITDNLWVGGCENGIPIPEYIDRVVSMYPWEEYRTHPKLKSYEKFEMYDSSDEPDVETIETASDKVVEYLKAGDNVLLNCQAGLNRSNLIASVALIKLGLSPSAAVALLRAKRSPAVLCNLTFERWVLSYGERQD